MTRYVFSGMEDSAWQQQWQIVIGRDTGGRRDDGRYRRDGRHGRDGQTEQDVFLDRFCDEVCGRLERQGGLYRRSTLDGNVVSEVHRPGWLQCLAFGPHRPY